MNLEGSVVAVDWEMWVWSETVEHTIGFYLHRKMVVFKDGFSFLCAASYTYTYTFSLNVMIIGQLDASCWPFHLQLAPGKH